MGVANSMFFGSPVSSFHDTCDKSLIPFQIDGPYERHG